MTDTIFQRIDAASVVVTDITYTSTRPGGERSPNPNVLLEHGYAFKSRTGSRMIHVMNTAFGHPGEQALPFDLRHMSWPILYHCAVDSASDQRRTARERLTKDLAVALVAIIGDATLPPAVPPTPAHPHDVRLLATVYRTLPLWFRQFLKDQDFGAPFHARRLDPLHEAAEWGGATYRFHNPALEVRFGAVREALRTLADLTAEHIYTYGVDLALLASAKTPAEREAGLQPGTSHAIRALNDAAWQTANALDALELAARDTIPLSPLAEVQSRG